MYANLRAEMKAKRITQKEVAAALGLSMRGFNLKLLYRSFVSEEMISIHSKFFPTSDWKILFKKT